MSEIISTGSDEQEKDVISENEPITAQYGSDGEAAADSSSLPESYNTEEDVTEPAPSEEISEEVKAAEVAEDLPQDINEEPEAEELAEEIIDQNSEESADEAVSTELRTEPMAEAIATEETEGSEDTVAEEPTDASAEPIEQTIEQAETIEPIEEILPVGNTALPAKKNIFKNRFASSIIMLISSLAILLASLFLPLAHSTVDMGKNVALDIEFTGVDSFNLLYYSTKSLSDKEISKTQLYKETNALSKKYKVSSKKIRESDRPYLEEIAKNKLLLELSSKETPLRLSVAASSAAYLVFLAVAMLMTWFSLKDFCAELTIKIKGVKMKRRPYTLPSRMLWLLVGLLPLLAYSFFEMSYFGLGERLSVFSYFGNGLSYGLGIIALLSIIATAYTVIFAVVSSKNKEAYSGKRFRKKLLFILLIALLLISLFLPVISITVRGGTKIDSPTQNVKFGVADLFATDKADMKYYRGTTSASMAEEIKATIKSLFSKKGTADTEMMLNDLIFGVDRNNVSAIYVAIQAMTYVVLGFIGLLLSLTFSATWYNSGCVGKIRAAKIFLGLSAIALIVLEGVLLVIANMAISGELMYLMSVGAGIGIALMLVCVVGIFTVRVEADVSGSYMDTWYDNADVTYAPYVIK